MSKKTYKKHTSVPVTPQKKAPPKWSFWAVLLAIIYLFVGSTLGILSFVRTSKSDVQTASAYSTFAEEQTTESDNTLNVVEFPNLIDLTGIDVSTSSYSVTCPSSNYFTCTVNSGSVWKKIISFDVLAGESYYFYVSFLNFSVGCSFVVYFGNNYYTGTSSSGFVPFTCSSSCTVGIYFSFDSSLYSGDFPFLISTALGLYNISDVDSDTLFNSLAYSVGKLDGYSDGYDKGSVAGYKKGYQDLIYGLDSIFYGSKVAYAYYLNNGSQPISLFFDLIIKGSVVSFSDMARVVPSSITSGSTSIYKDAIFIELPKSVEFDIRTLNLSGVKTGTTVEAIGYFDDSYLERKITSSISYNVRSDGQIFPSLPTSSYSLKYISVVIIYGSGYDNSGSFISKLWENSNIYFSQSVSTDFDNGYKKGQDDQRITDYNEWYLGRYNAGYSAGVDSAGSYSFLGLLGAVVDAPVKAVSGLLNFNLLGFNMASFFYAILTLALIIAIIRLVV